MSTPSTPDTPGPDDERPVERTLTLGEPTSEPTSGPTGEPTSEPTSDSTITPPPIEAATIPAATTQAPTIQAPTAPEPAAARGIRMRTVVFGLVLLAIAGSVLVAQLTEVSIDGGAVFLGLMISCGVLLIVGARRS
jgi:hypothetical protein